MAAMKAARSASAPRMLACRGAGSPALHHPGQLRPAPQDVHVVQHHRQDGLGVLSQSSGRRSAGTE